MVCPHIRILLLFATAAAVIGSAAWAGTISGEVTLEGDPPVMPTVSMVSDPACGAKHPAPPLSEAVVVNEAGQLANVIVHITGGLPPSEYPAPEKPAVLDQLGCVFAPHVAVVQVGQPVDLLNSDDTFHNVHAYPAVNTEFNMAMPKFRKRVSWTFDKPEPDPFPIKCEVHPWMLGWVAVMPHPFYAVTDAVGRFQLNDLPPGRYEVQAWHEKFGIRTGTATVEADEEVALDFSFQVDAGTAGDSK